MDSFLRTHFLNLLALDLALLQIPHAQVFLPQLTGQATWPVMKRSLAGG